ncbi:hypothetical protein T440DRAFT_114594 [Plenodomus tracheiphilus IPT5]|uniref:Uncharacterized protein n=1 Tax=Plenodomus tracheiphilus IPT5 TaxID=1408161 RepID=A0A6A7B6W0_9PLEO|nr:hypothetical protein T440DRAFT_114594 [Plenodomus tracheiphilus IPT5]
MILHRHQPSHFVMTDVRRDVNLHSRIRGNNRIMHMSLCFCRYVCMYACMHACDRKKLYEHLLAAHLSCRANSITRSMRAMTLECTTHILAYVSPFFLDQSYSGVYGLESLLVSRVCSTHK